MSRYSTVRTPTLAIGCLEWNSTGSRSAVLLHGWPDSPETWIGVAERLAAQGYRVLCPALRGFGPTRFLEADTPRSGELAALGRDLLDFIDALHLERPLLVGHDWGARAVANACGLRADAASAMVMLSVGYGTNDPHQAISHAQAQAYWYHWFMATPRGQQAIVEEDAKAFARTMWDTWSPQGWYTAAAFEEAARAFENPDWAAVVLHSYRHRWGFVPGDPAYAEDGRRLNPAPRLSVPTLVLHGAADACNHPDTSAGKEAFFCGPYQRIVLPGVGHFPQREAAAEVADGILRFVQSHA
ncbi:MULTISPECIES: alpha/beta hydrolase [unclassified Variovorax]|uniref:alpha/beta fold hydrolase n=1 Tax=unclassified Variovorax TaxID=663243 RepID=UPI002577EC95|nr:MULTISPECIES: alpha/beta hydrolase [unclassified Variovorax]MDM0090939.1 alpha/beta hydrolase [Variovorax sp. J22G40]MDM0149059.1 alpha/beta hydrolase [Variovorax sp. J2P1-31]